MPGMGGDLQQLGKAVVGEPERLRQRRRRHVVRLPAQRADVTVARLPHRFQQARLAQKAVGKAARRGKADHPRARTGPRSPAWSPPARGARRRHRRGSRPCCHGYSCATPGRTAHDPGSPAAAPPPASASRATMKKVAGASCLRCTSATARMPSRHSSSRAPLVAHHLLVGRRGIGPVAMLPPRVDRLGIVPGHIVRHDATDPTAPPPPRARSNPQPHSTGRGSQPVEFATIDFTIFIYLYFELVDIPERLDNK